MRIPPQLGDWRLQTGSLADSEPGRKQLREVGNQLLYSRIRFFGATDLAQGSGAADWVPGEAWDVEFVGVFE